MYSTVAANNRAYGADIVPVSYNDIFLAETIFIIGSNCALIRALTLSVASVDCVRPWE
jgi:anaerobic selenocysteine-containing dehydrogenase